MINKVLWFSKEEYDLRIKKVQKMLLEAGADYYLAFQPESVTYLTGFYVGTGGYASFQFAVIPQTGDPVVFFRNMYRYYFDTLCAYDQFEMWSDSKDPVIAGQAFLGQRIKKADRIVVEKDAWPLTAARYEVLFSDIDSDSIVDGSDWISKLRLIKSAQEIEYQRKAGKAAEAGMQAAIQTAKAGTSERKVAAEICYAMVNAGADFPGPGVMASGERALHLHGEFNDRILEKGDTFMIETMPCVRQYHARFLRSFKVGEAKIEDEKLMGKLIEIQDRALSKIAPGVEARIPDRIYREGVLQAGLQKEYTNKTFYSVGLLLSPSGGEPLEATPESTWSFQPGMTLHTYMLIKGFGISETIVITNGGYERLTNFPRKLFIS